MYDVFGVGSLSLIGLLAASYLITGSWATSGIIIAAIYSGLSYWVHPQVNSARVQALLGNVSQFTVAHRGAGIDAPENTLAAIRLAKSRGAHAVEIDIAFTADGEAVVLHDDTVDRTTNGTGRIDKMTLAEARTLDAAAHHVHAAAYKGEKIPTLDEAVSLCEQLGLKVFLDIKGDSAELTVRTLVDTFSRYPYLLDNAVVASFQPGIIYRVRSAIPNAITGLTHQHKVNQFTADGQRKNPGAVAHFFAMIKDVLLEWSHNNWLWYVCGNSIYVICKIDVSPVFLTRWRSQGVHVVTWTVNTPQEKDYFHLIRCPFMTDTLVNAL